MRKETILRSLERVLHANQFLVREHPEIVDNLPSTHRRLLNRALNEAHLIVKTCEHAARQEEEAVRHPVRPGSPTDSDAR